MQTRVTAKPEQDVIAAIQTLNLESVKVRVMDPELGEGWTREYADSIETAYKHYLTMLVKYQDDAEDILPSKDVDEFWHTHILQTMKYADDCEAVFGTFVHHNPHIGKLSQTDLDKRVAHADKTRRLYEREYGMQGSEAAWAGKAFGPGEAAVSSFAIKAEKAAVSSFAIRPENAAVSSFAIRAENAAVSSFAIKAERAAVSSFAIRPENAAVSSFAIRAENAAVSSFAIRPENAAVSSFAVRAAAPMTMQGAQASS